MTNEELLRQLVGKTVLAAGFLVEADAENDGIVVLRFTDGTAYSFIGEPDGSTIWVHKEKTT